uniref:Fibrinogen C-terminal domain-containing protein n=1 Tax=Amphimedon queenslandica TaxID=400682 RepID=A0A1X7VDH7_AMPQE
MDKEDLQHIYEVNDLQEYENNKGSSRPHMIIRETGGAGMGRLASMVLGIGVVLLFISLVAIIATTASILTHLTTLPICDNSQTNTDNIVNPTTNTGTSDSLGGSNAINCSISNVLEGQQNQLGIVQNQIGQLLNATHETASKVNEIRTLANEQAAISVNNTYNIEQVMQTTGNTAQKLVNIVNTLTNLKNTSTSTAGVVDDILLVVDELLELHSDNSTLPYSCEEIKQRQPNSPSGVYLLINPNGNGVTYAYCHMGELCGSGGGWKRIAYIDMSDATQNCPTGFRLYQSGGVRACGRPSSSTASCTSVQFPSNGFSYSQICGRVTGYQYATTDGLASAWPNHNNLNSYYVDGISITRGSPRQHVWSFVSGFSGNVLLASDYTCPCGIGSTQTTQSFVGNNYFCESGNLLNMAQFKLFTSNPLWDGQNCGSVDINCCSAPGIPWFHRTYSVATNDNLELRVCGDQGTGDEDTPFGYYEIYIK